MGIGGELVGDVEELMVIRTLRSRSLFRMIGTRSQCWKAEQEIEQAYPGMRCLLMPSATMSLSIVLELLDLKPGQEVLITPFGWVANWSCIVRAGLVPRFLPLDNNLQLSADAVRARINANTGAVIVTHLQGRGQQTIAGIADICRDAGIPLLEDIAQSFGVKIAGQRAGSFGAAAWCSLNHHKMLSTGDGGFVLVRDEAMFQRVCARQDQGNNLREGKRKAAENLEPGLSLRTHEITASILRAQIARYHFIRTRITRLHALVSDALKKELKLELLPTHQGDIPFSTFFRLPPGARYKSQAETGWHVADNVPWLADRFRQNLQQDPELATTIENMRQAAAVGSGFVDAYHGIVLGIGINDAPEAVDQLIKQLKEVL